MKKSLKIISLLLVLVMSVVLLASCSTYGKIQKAFEENGYVLQNPDKESTGEIETEDGVITYTIHTFKKEGAGIITGVLSGVIVWEFCSDKDLMNAIEESETLKGIIKDAQNSDYVNGNCVLTTINPEAVEIFKGTK